jgi:ATP-dependent DNA helicase RecQ
VCLAQLSHIDDALITAQKILSCILRLDQRFDGNYTASVLIGSREKRLIENGHDAISTYGLLSDHSKDTVHNWINQLVGQDYIQKAGEYNVLTVTPKGRQVLNGQEMPRLLKPAMKPAKVSKVATDSWEGVDKGLFEALRKLRRTLAAKRGVPAYVVFGDAALRDMARRRPITQADFLKIKGVGETKSKQFGKAVLAAIKDYCAANSLETDTDQPCVS